MTPKRTVDEYVAALAPDQRAIVDALRALVRSADSGLLQTSGSKMGHLKIRAVADIPVPDVRRLVRAAVELNAVKGNPATRR